MLVPVTQGAAAASLRIEPAPGSGDQASQDVGIGSADMPGLGAAPFLIYFGGSGVPVGH